MLDIVGVLNAQDDYTKNRNYWKYLKTKLKKEESQLVSVTNQLKMTAADEKRYLTDVLYYDGVVLLAKSFPNTRASRFVEWFTNSDETIWRSLRLCRSDSHQDHQQRRLYFLPCRISPALT